MKIIAELVEFLEDELDAVEEYAEMAVKIKPQYREIADTLMNMAVTEKPHLDMIHTYLVKLVEKQHKDNPGEVPQGMLDVWSWKHKKLMNRLAEVTIVIENYQELV